MVVSEVDPLSVRTIVIEFMYLRLENRLKSLKKEFCTKIVLVDPKIDPRQFQQFQTEGNMFKF